MRVIGNCVLIVMLLVCSGGQWALLQSVAWTSMLASHLKTDNFSDAVKQTFDGRHPCPLCLAIQAAKKTEKKSAIHASVQKIEFPPLAAAFTVYASAALRGPAPADAFADSLGLTPPTPPPRRLPA